MPMEEVMLAVSTELKSWAAVAFQSWMVFSSVGIFLALRFLSALPWLGERKWYRRILPILPEVFGLAAAFSGAIPILCDQSVSLKVFGGLWCAYLSKSARKILGQTFLGDDSVIEKGKR